MVSPVPRATRRSHAFERHGLSGLLPRKRGPKAGRKLSAEVRGFVHALLAEAPELSAQTLAQRIAERFAVSVHPRSSKRALSPAARKKGGLAAAGADAIVAEHERLRELALGTAHAPGRGWAVFLRRGMRAWGETCQDLTPSPPGVPVPMRDTVPSAAVVQVLAAMVLAVHQGRLP